MAKTIKSRAICVGSVHREFNDKESGEINKWVVQQFFGEDGIVCEYNDYTDTLIPDSAITTFEDLEKGNVKVGDLELEKYVSKGKKAEKYVNFSL